MDAKRKQRKRRKNKEINQPLFRKDKFDKIRMKNKNVGFLITGLAIVISIVSIFFF